jgi:hypothetical protein
LHAADAEVSALRHLHGEILRRRTGQNAAAAIADVHVHEDVDLHMGRFRRPCEHFRLPRVPDGQHHFAAVANQVDHPRDLAGIDNR